MPFPNIGPGELILILIIALVVLGPGKLPDVAASLGKSVREFRKAATDVSEAGKLDAPAAAPAAPAAAPTTAPAPSAEIAPAAPPAPAPPTTEAAPNTLSGAADPNTLTAAGTTSDPDRA
jgi:sec-independent protein translocase protein TatA